MVDISKVAIYFIGNSFISVFCLFCWNRLNKFKINKLCIFFLWLLITSTITFINCVFLNPYKLIITVLTLIVINYFLITKEIKQSIIMVVISQTILALVETTFVIGASILIGSQIDSVIYDTIPFIILNGYILILSCLICKTKIIKKVFDLFYENKNIKKNFETYIYPLVIIFIMIIATIESHIQMSFTLILTINTIMTIIFISIMITSIKTKEKFNKINSKYETSISSLKEYEIMIDKFRVSTHENKNEFYTIRNMLKEENNDEKVIKYIDKLIDNKIKDSDKIMKKTAKIPEGGLRATIYSKLCLMDKLKIKYKLNISRDVRTTDLINLDEDIILKICKILGVFLDNAIEAVKHLKKKEIFIEIYSLNNYLCIDITNNFKGNLDLDKISNTKYTTKGDGHGYGLTLVSKLLEEEPNKLENEKSINRDTFTQTLKIKM